MAWSNIAEGLCSRVNSEWNGSHGVCRDGPIGKPNSRSLRAPDLCIIVDVDIRRGIVERDVQELETSLHLGLGKL